MFDAKSMLDVLMRGGAQQSQQLSLGLQSTDQPGKQSSPGALREDVPQSAGALEDMLRKVTGGGQSGLNDILAKLQQQGGNLPEILGQVLGQATSGVKEGAARVDDATGASRYARDAIGKATGRSPEELLAKLKELIANNQVGAGAALAGLSALVLGTSAGRSLAGSAAKVGSLALIGGLAYKAYQNYQQGRPVLTGQKPPQQALLAAPTGS